jgi:hypothetical protein
MGYSGGEFISLGRDVNLEVPSSIYYTIDSWDFRSVNEWI